jgi:HEAT repeat protein
MEFPFDSPVLARIPQTMSFKRNGLAALAALIITVPLYAEKSVDEYIADLQSSDAAVQIQACRSLGAAKAEGATGALAQLLLNSSDDRVAAHAAAALGAIGKKGEASAALVQAAGSSNRPAVQYASLLALANIDDDDREEDLERLLDAVSQSDADALNRDLAEKLKAVEDR